MCERRKMKINVKSERGGHGSGTSGYISVSGVDFVENGRIESKGYGSSKEIE